MAKERIPISTIDSTYSDGDILYGYDINRIIDVLREAANTNKLDINKLLTGSDYFYIAEDIFGLQQLAIEQTPADKQNGFIFNGEEQAQHLELYKFNGTTGAWDYISDTSITNPYTDTVTIAGKVIDANPDSELLQLDLSAGVKLQIGQQVFFRAKFTEPVNKGDAMQFAGAQGDHFLVKKAVQDEIAVNPEYFVGLAAQTFTTQNQFGYVLEFGPLKEIKVEGLNYGDILWYDSSGTVPGAVTNVRPSTDYQQIRIAAVINSQNETNGEWLVRPDRIQKLGITTFLQPNAPSSYGLGDLWFDTSEIEFEQFVLNGGTFSTQSFTDTVDGGLFTTMSYTDTVDGGIF